MNAHHFKVAIIGGGPAGIGVAVGLAKRGVGSVVLIERRNEIGGTPMGYPKKSGGVPTFVEWTRGRVVFGQELVGRMLQRLAKTDTAIRSGYQARWSASVYRRRQHYSRQRRNNGYRG